ncbi:MAG: hypothetical protein M0037_07970 [Betaproteobacteria bacterium]|nr:hypothetical protein [Betaproteobacteria bacterium]
MRGPMGQAIQPAEPGLVVQGDPPPAVSALHGVAHASPQTAFEQLQRTLAKLKSLQAALDLPSAPVATDSSTLPAAIRPVALSREATTPPAPDVVGHVAAQGAGTSDPGPSPGEVLIPTGTVMSGILDMDLNSDFEGDWRGMLVQDVYDIHRNYIILPKGTTIIGKTVLVGGPNSILQNRMALTVQWAVRPDGTRIDFRKTAALDAAGVAALRDQVNYHALAQLGGVAAYAVLGLGPAMSISDGAPMSSQDYATTQFTQGIRQQIQPFAARFLNIVPTITLRAGTPFKIFVESDLYAKPWARIDNTIYMPNSGGTP